MTERVADLFYTEEIYAKIALIAAVCMLPILALISRSWEFLTPVTLSATEKIAAAVVAVFLLRVAHNNRYLRGAKLTRSSAAAVLLGICAVSLPWLWIAISAIFLSGKIILGLWTIYIAICDVVFAVQIRKESGSSEKN